MSATRTAKIEIRLTPKEKKTIAMQAKRRKLSVSDWVRRCLELNLIPGTIS